MRYALPLIALLLLPASAIAAPAATSTFAFSRSMIVSDAAPTNAYYAAGSLNVLASTLGDLSALAGSMTISGPVKGDALLAGGVVTLHSAVSGDVRVAGGNVTLAGPIGGDEVAFGGSVTDTGGGGLDAFIVAESVSMTDGATGPVTIYANNVSLGGTFTSDVRVVSSGQITVLPGTIIHGSLSYEAPEQASIASTAAIKGGVDYTGTSYLPTSAQAHALALAAVGVFLVVKILGALILAGLIAGIFPRLTEEVAAEALDRPARTVLLTTLLGFAVVVATPVLIILLALTFVGLGLALVIGLSYLLLCVLALIYTGIVVGAALARNFAKRESVLWRDAVLGMLVICIISVVPAIGLLLIGILAAFTCGSLAKIFYAHAFSHGGTEPLL
jgi:cytoskeletal protein CcmA (bactofilin family)